MNKRNAKLYIEDIYASIQKIEKYTKNISKEKFQSEDMIIDAVIRNLEIIGEEAGNISEEIKERYDAIPWNKMNGLRNITIHEYFGVDTDIIWEIIKNDLPPNKEEIKKLL